MAHLVRNAWRTTASETPEERLVGAEVARGTIRLDAYHQCNHVVNRNF